MLAHLAVDARRQRQGLAWIEFVGRNEPRAGAARAIEILALRDVELAVPQPVAQRSLVAERQPGNVLVGAFLRDVAPLTSDDDQDLALVIELD